MSSIKQVQDLQSRIAELTEENALLRTRLSDPKGPEPKGPIGKAHHRTESVSSESGQSQKRPVPVMKGFDRVRQNIENYAHGIFDSPFHQDNRSASTIGPSTFSDLPSRAEFVQLSRAYFESIHRLYPIFDWSAFRQEAEQVYNERSLLGKRQEWVGLLFAVLACASLHDVHPPTGSQHAPRSSAYLRLASQSVDPFPQNASVHLVSVAFLLSLFATERNMKTAGAAWLASTVKMAQVLRLHVEIDAPPAEAEMRRRLWWSVYTLDRLTFLDSSLPMCIKDADCSITLPAALNSPGYGHSADEDTFSVALALFHVARQVTHVEQALRSVIVTPQMLQDIDERLQSVFRVLPRPYQHTHDTPLDPTLLPPLLALQSARFLAYRHNLSPVCRQSERMEALQRCSLVAQDTSTLISRATHISFGTASPGGWQAKALHLASNMICMHLWRCILISCFCGDYETALSCARLAAAIGSTRKVNGACGKHLAFFLGHLFERVRSGNWDHHLLELDEEMLAYASGDLQGHSQQAWVWEGRSETADPSPISPPHPNAQSHHGHGEPMQGNDLESDWSDWAGIEHRIRQIQEEHRARVGQPSFYHSPPHNPGKRLQLTSDTAASMTRAEAGPQRTPSDRSRISIANII
ncbi:uncharacterized protein EI97DRAFT_417307 [Westerdykella ornata]|uniref:Xylanolytic transcriptional activator regulatory domain-containing protein n=1 Tax=Westerdykella ornata TaxID=318751 RepID=A0A6A6JL24_WESOR|nr:uncharacterized protein EI97DRAFT_417307 [Westerdykella ornata]KAF2277182.1 hypothetical protein EI97DRAFT_417307 [Westerdykella ornata]